MLDRRTLLLGAAALPIACTTIRALPERRLRVATFNIWHDMGDWPARRALLIDALREADPDVIALQEVLQDSARNLPNQAETLAQALGGYSVSFVSIDPEGKPRRYGNAILSRLPVIAEASKKLEPLTDYRTALRVRVEAGGRPIDIVGTHLAWQPDAGPVRARQVADLMAWLPQDGVPLVVMGDFNAPLSDSGLAALTALGVRLPGHLLEDLELGPALIAFIVVGAPLGEELVFRGWLSGRPGHVGATLVLLAAGLLAGAALLSLPGPRGALALVAVLVLGVGDDP